MTYILISYLGEFSRYGGSKFNFALFYGFSSKWQLKLFPLPVVTSDSNFSSSTLLKTLYISIWYVADCQRYRGQSSKIQKLSK